jgi:hypothetical protein
MRNTATNIGHTDSTVVHDANAHSNAITSRYKFSNIAWLKGGLSQCVLRAAVDWKNFQSAENANSLYMAVLAMTGEEPHVPFELD